MPTPARNTLAVIGAGPIGLEAALAAVEHDLDVHVFERGEPGGHPAAWGHVRMFTPWRMNLGPATRRALGRAGSSLPDPESCPTGAEYAERLQAVARLPELAGRVHAHSQVVHVSRRGTLKADHVGDPARADQPFRLLVRDAGGRENFLHAFAVIDASGTYGQPNWAGSGGIPARNEEYLAPQMAYHLEDVRGLSRARYADRRTMVIGAGECAATTVAALVQLAADAPATRVAWVTRGAAQALYAAFPGDPLPERDALRAGARAALGGAHPMVEHVGGAGVEGFEYNSATHRYRVTLAIGDQPRVEEVDQVIVNTGFGPDHHLYRELQVHECYASRAPMKLAAALLDADATDCLEVPAFGPDVLASPEPNFYILGGKSYGRGSTFLLETGFRQVSDVLPILARAAAVPAAS